MTENEKAEQIGRLAEEYSRVRGKLNHIIEKLNHLQSLYSILSNPQTFQSLRIENGKLLLTPNPAFPYGQQAPNLDGLLDHPQLLEIVEEECNLTKELESLTGRLKALAPHLL